MPDANHRTVAYDETSSAHRIAASAAQEIADAVSAVDPRQLGVVVGAVLIAPVVFVAGQGRSGLIARAWAMRLMHLGKSVHVVGETTAPAFTSSALLLVLSATGATRSSVRHAEHARELAGVVGVLTASPLSPLADLADFIVDVPARREVQTRQHAGSLFEQTCLVLADSVCAAVQLSLGLPTALLNARHANLT
jgi:6-phospho-3-hexuloisomerase